jgi:hypothetical protein
MTTIFQVILNVIGGAITIALIELGKLWYDKSVQRRFKRVFGVDPFAISQFHLVYAHLALIKVVDQNGKLIPYPYVKPGEETRGTGFSIERPVSSCEVRAAKYLAATIGKEAKLSPVLSSDIETKGKLDVSFAAFGGPLSNYKTRDVIENASNNLLKFDNNIFTSATSGESVVPFERNFDYGLILKIHPAQFPHRNWFVCAGRGEWGTSGAGWYLANKWKEIHKFAGDSTFAIVVRVKRDQDESAEPVFTLKA